MTINLVLVSLQTLFLSLYGVNGIVQSIASKKRRWAAVFAILLGIAISCIFLGSYIKSNIQLLLFLLLVLDYLLRSLVFSYTRLENTLIFCAITFIAYAIMYFQWERPIVWIVAPFILVALIGLMKKWPHWFATMQEYFLKTGALLTLLFMVEPVFLSVQRNLKPIATIPITSIVNRQNCLLLSVLLLLMLGGFFWKEKSRP
ncbi:MAG: hypothetical protein AAGI25_18845 [Bacteroidota bacterium]